MNILIIRRERVSREFTARVCVCARARVCVRACRCTDRMQSDYIELSNFNVHVVDRKLRFDSASGELVRYSNYGWLPSWSGVPVSASAALMASTVTAKSQFSVVAGNLNHNQMVNAGLWLGLSGGGELILSRRMQVNYVP